jgi:hypothetical protein
MLFSALGKEDKEEILEEMYPDKEYDPDRTKEPELVPGMPGAPGAPQPEGATGAPPQAPKPRMPHPKRIGAQVAESREAQMKTAVAQLRQALVAIKERG